MQFCRSRRCCPLKAFTSRDACSPALEARLEGRWKLGLAWLGAPEGLLLAEDGGVMRWVDLNPFGRTHRTPTNAQFQCAPHTVSRPAALSGRPFCAGMALRVHNKGHCCCMAG